MAAYGDTGKDKTDSKRLYDLQAPDREVLEYFVDNIVDCGLYRSEYKECRKWRSRIDQYFVYGQKLDCDHMNEVYKACKKMREGNEDGRLYVLAYEQAKVDFRMENAQGNDVWEYRTRVYEDLSSDLTVTDDVEAIEMDKETMLQKNTEANNKQNNNNRNISRIVPSDIHTPVVENESKSKIENTNVTENSPSIVQTDNSIAVKKGWCVIS